MNLTELFSNEYAKIEADQQQKLIKITWLQHVSNAVLREVLVKSSELARSSGLHYWLFDLRKLSFTTSADNYWSANELFTTFDLQQQHRLACVATPQNVEMMTGVTVQEAIADHPELAGKVDLQVFVSEESALQWLFQEEQTQT